MRVVEQVDDAHEEAERAAAQEALPRQNDAARAAYLAGLEAEKEAETGARDIRVAHSPDPP